MALDFAVMTEDKTSADIVSLEWSEHEVLITLAQRLGLSQILRVEDYFEEVEWAFTELKALSEDISLIKKSAVPTEIGEFAHNLDALVTLAVSRRQPLSAVPD